jgi:hypothetical protein
MSLLAVLLGVLFLAWGMLKCTESLVAAIDQLRKSQEKYLAEISSKLDRIHSAGPALTSIESQLEALTGLSSSEANRKSSERRMAGWDKTVKEWEEAGCPDADDEDGDGDGDGDKDAEPPKR